MTESPVNLAKQFIETKLACKKALQHLKPGVEIRLSIEGYGEAAIYFDGQQARLEERAAVRPDVEFRAKTEAVRRLSEYEASNLADTGIEILREILAGQIQIKVCGSIFGVIRNGYLGIIKEAGPDFFSFLKDHGLSSMAQVVSLIRRLKTP